MHDNDFLAESFESHRLHLRSVAYRMLGSFAEADDAVQEAWLRLDRSRSETIDNLGGWLTTVVGRVCLDMLRTRRHRREGPSGPAHPIRRLSSVPETSTPLTAASHAPPGRSRQVPPRLQSGNVHRAKRATGDCAHRSFE